jgi:hypothetical protein
MFFNHVFTSKNLFYSYVSISFNDALAVLRAGINPDIKETMIEIASQMNVPKIEIVLFKSECSII